MRQAYSNVNNKLRASVVTDPVGKRKNTKDNTPAIIHMEIVPGIIGLGIGGTPEKSMLMAKESLMQPIDIDEIYQKENNTLTTMDKLRIELFKKIN